MFRCNTVVWFFKLTHLSGPFSGELSVYAGAAEQLCFLPADHTVEPLPPPVHYAITAGYSITSSFQSIKQEGRRRQWKRAIVFLYNNCLVLGREASRNSSYTLLARTEWHGYPSLLEGWVITIKTHKGYGHIWLLGILFPSLEIIPPNNKVDGGLLSQISAQDEKW